MGAEGRGRGKAESGVVLGPGPFVRIVFPRGPGKTSRDLPTAFSESDLTCLR